MKNPVVIVDPLSSGTALAPLLKSRGVPTIAVTLPHVDRIGFGVEFDRSDFDEIIPVQPELEQILRAFEPRAILPGTESGVSLAQDLAAALTPGFANDPTKAECRLHKALMQEALEEAGVPALKTLSTASEQETEAWIEENGLADAPLILKPPISAGSDKVFHIHAGGDWRPAFRRILNEPSKITGLPSETVVVQEQAVGTEFAVGTVSAHGKHYLAHLIRYNKTSSDDRETVFDHVEFVDCRGDEQTEVFHYAQEVLDALGIRWGAAHTEIMLTNKGPRLIETGARMCGGPTVEFARVATGSSQADKLVEAVAEGDVQAKDYGFQKTVVPVFLKAPTSGTISNAEALDAVHALPTFLNDFIWFKNGDHVNQTVDYLTSIGIVALAGDRTAIFRDYEKVRQMESELVVEHPVAIKDVATMEPLASQGAR